MKCFSPAKPALEFSISSSPHGACAHFALGNCHRFTRESRGRVAKVRMWMGGPAPNFGRPPHAQLPRRRPEWQEVSHSGQHLPCHLAARSPHFWSQWAGHQPPQSWGLILHTHTHSHTNTLTLKCLTCILTLLHTHTHTPFHTHAYTLTASHVLTHIHAHS